MTRLRGMRPARVKPPILGPMDVDTNPHHQTVLPSYKKGGIVKKTGPAIVHKGERVVPVKKKRIGTSDGSMSC